MMSLSCRDVTAVTNFEAGDLTRELDQRLRLFLGCIKLQRLRHGKSIQNYARS
jgi:hypothetical protein